MTSRYALQLSNSSGDSITCEGGVESVSGGQYWVEFADGGVGEVHRREPDAVVLFEISCLESVGASCEYFDEYECEPLDCGLCRCSLSGSSLVSSMTWAREGATLTVETSEGSDTLAYCATDAEMVHVSESGRLRDTLEKVYPVGVPEPCAGRTKETCPGAGCSLGVCVGGGDCDRANNTGERVCLSIQDCTWEPETCGGKADESCDLKDYARGVPGCELLSSTPTCVGTPKPCESQRDCAAAGCSIGPGCVGGKQVCGSWDKAIPGCVCSGSACEGTFQCSDVGTAADCATAGVVDACRWTKQVCVGTSTACNELTPDQCQKTEGCALQAE